METRELHNCKRQELRDLPKKRFSRRTLLWGGLSLFATAGLAACGKATSESPGPNPSSETVYVTPIPGSSQAKSSSIGDPPVPKPLSLTPLDLRAAAAGDGYKYVAITLAIANNNRAANQAHMDPSEWKSIDLSGGDPFFSNMSTVNATLAVTEGRTYDLDVSLWSPEAIGKSEEDLVFGDVGFAGNLQGLYLPPQTQICGVRKQVLAATGKIPESATPETLTISGIAPLPLTGMPFRSDATLLKSTCQPLLDDSLPIAPSQAEITFQGQQALQTVRIQVSLPSQFTDPPMTLEIETLDKLDALDSDTLGQFLVAGVQSDGRVFWADLTQQQDDCSFYYPQALQSPSGFVKSLDAGPGQTGSYKMCQLSNSTSTVVVQRAVPSEDNSDQGQIMWVPVLATRV